MNRTDYPVFAKWLVELSAYFPTSRVDLAVVVQGYFRALMDLDVGALATLMDHVLKTCRFFPTVVELREAAQQLRAIGSACHRCPTGHGVHEGHRISHYDSGPFCQTCQAPMPVPPGYVQFPPPREFVPLIPERTEQISNDEMREMVERVLAEFNKRSEIWLYRVQGGSDYQPQLHGEALKARRRELRRQAGEATP